MNSTGGRAGRTFRPVSDVSGRPAGVFRMARRLGVGERFRIKVLVAQGFSDERIALALGRDRTTIRRERKPCEGGSYCAQRAQAMARVRAKRSRVSKLASVRLLGELVHDWLKERL